MVFSTSCALSGMLIDSLDRFGDLRDLERLATEGVDTLEFASVVSGEQVSELAGVVDFWHENDALVGQERLDLAMGQRPELARGEGVCSGSPRGEPVDRLDHRAPGRAPGDDADLGARVAVLCGGGA